MILLNNWKSRQMIPLENVWFFLNISIENKSRGFTPTNSPHFNPYSDGSHTCVCVCGSHIIRKPVGLVGQVVENYQNCLPKVSKQIHRSRTSEAQVFRQHSSSLLIPVLWVQLDGCFFNDLQWLCWFLFFFCGCYLYRVCVSPQHPPGPCQVAKVLNSLF